MLPKVGFLAYQVPLEICIRNGAQGKSYSSGLFPCCSPLCSCTSELGIGIPVWGLCQPLRERGTDANREGHLTLSTGVVGMRTGWPREV